MNAEWMNGVKLLIDWLDSDIALVWYNFVRKKLKEVFWQWRVSSQGLTIVVPTLKMSKIMTHENVTPNSGFVRMCAVDCICVQWTVHVYGGLYTAMVYNCIWILFVMERIFFM